MPPFFPNDFVSPSEAVALVGSSLYGEQWNGCPTLSEVGSLHTAIAALRNERTTARQRELWPAVSASSRLMRRRARQLELSDERAAKRFVSLGVADKKAIDDEIEAKFAEELARGTRCWLAESRLVGLLYSARVTATLLESSGNTHEMPCEYWASDQAGSAVNSGKASYRPATYKSRLSGVLQGRVLIPKADLMAALEGAPDGGDKGAPLDKGQEDAPAQATPAEPSDKQERPQRNRKRDVETEAKLRLRIEMVLVKARAKWPNPKKRPEIDAVAKDLERLHGKELGYKFETIRKILRGIYEPSRRLKIAGL